MAQSERLLLGPGPSNPYPEVMEALVAANRGAQPAYGQDEITARMIELARAGHFVVRLKGGDPFLFGRGGEELRDLTEAGVDVVVIPGVTSALAAGASIGVPATLRGVASSVAITTARGDTGGRLRVLAAASDTLIVLMARASLHEIAAEIGHAVGPSTPAAVISRATFDDQRSVSGPLADIARLADAARLAAPATLIVGEVVNAVSARSLAELATG